MQSLISLCSFMQKQNNAQLLRIQNQLQINPGFGAKYTFCKPTPDELYDELFHNIFKHFADQITIISTISQLDPIKAKMAEISNESDDDDIIHSSNSKRAKLDPPTPNVFDKLPNVMIEEILGYLKFMDTIKFERVNRMVFMACRQNGIQYIEHGDLDHLIVMAHKESNEHIYKFDRYQNVRNIVIGYTVTNLFLRQYFLAQEMNDLVTILTELIGKNWRIERLTIYNNSLSSNQMKDFCQSVMVHICDPKSLKELYISTKSNFEMEWIQSFTALKQLSVICVDFVPFDNVLIQLQALKLVITEHTEWSIYNRKVSLDKMVNLESLHIGRCYFLEPLTASICSNLKEICLYDTIDFGDNIRNIETIQAPQNTTTNTTTNTNSTTNTANITTNTTSTTNTTNTIKTPLFPQLERILISHVNEFEMNFGIQRLFREAPALQSITLKSQFAYHLKKIKKIIEKIFKLITDNIKTMKLAIYVPFGELERIQFNDILSIIATCDARFDEFMIIYSGPMDFNPVDSENELRDDFDQKIHQQYADNIYGFYRDMEIKRTTYCNSMTYRTESFIFRKNMKDATPDHFNLKCNMCEYQSIF